MEYSQEKRDKLFVRMYGNWDNPVLHLPPDKLAEAGRDQKRIEALDRARHFAKKDHPIVDAYIRARVFGESKTPVNVLKWHDHTATGAAHRDTQTGTPYVQVMDNQTFNLVWMNMQQFVGFIGTMHYDRGRKTGLVKHLDTHC